MKNKAWTNQYIFQVNTKPGYLLNWEDGAFDETQLLEFQQKRSQYSSIYCELGSGSGSHLIERAAEDPTSLYVGIEQRYKRAFRTIEKAEKKELTNLIVLRCLAKDVTSVFSERSIAGIYINFPDPWSKRRWYKHRMLSPEFLPEIHRLLCESGFLAYKTDHAEAFTDALSVIKQSDLFRTEEMVEDLYASPLLADNVVTEFEMLFRSKGLPIYYWRGVSVHLPC